MALTLLGEHPLAKDDSGQLRSRIGTIFLRTNTLVTLPGVHATQRIAYSDFLNTQRQAHNLPPLSPDEEITEWDASVDLIMESDFILIRPDPENMAAAFIADERLQELVSKRQIRFLNAMNERIRQAIKQRGECWRISPLPQSPSEMERMVRASRIAIGQLPIYYYSAVTGTRYITYQDFASLAALPPATLALQLQEIRDYSARLNRLGYRELDFFGASKAFNRDLFDGIDLLNATPDQLTALHENLRARFHSAVPAELRDDTPGNLEWRNRMFAALTGQQLKTVADEIVRGLSAEFFMQIQWLPGGRIQDGEFIFDSIFEEQEKHPANPDLAFLCDENAKGFIFNFIREFGDVEYVNLGRVSRSLSLRPQAMERRGVYIAELKQRDMPEPVVRVIRTQKWNIADHLDAGRPLLDAIMQAEDYTEFILDRRLGCRQLGMNLITGIYTRRIYHPYTGTHHQYRSHPIWSTYFERDYINGVATDKIPASRYRSPEFSERLAQLLGQAAAAAMIVGKADANNIALFDDGDEVLVEDNQGRPFTIITSDHTGAFLAYNTRLEDSVSQYARPINRRLHHVPNPENFATAYLDAFVRQFTDTQHKYRTMKRGFDTLFKHRVRDEHGSFAYRWEKVLDRLANADASKLAAGIRRHITSPLP
jgi:hypothetical protein